MTLISTTTLSGASTTISSISGSYTNLYLLMYGLTGDDAIGTYNIELNGAATGMNRINIINTSTSNNTDIAINMGENNVINKTSTSNAWFLEIKNYASTSTFKPFIGSGTYLNTSSVQKAQFFTGGFSSTTALSSIKFSTYGNLSTGTVLLYGVK